MARALLFAITLLVLIAGTAAAQYNPPSLPQKILLPDGPKLERPEDTARRKEAQLQANHEQNLKDVARIQELAREVEQDLKEHGYNNLTPATLSKSQEMEKLAKAVRARLRRY